jgi:hypothetical protein
MARTCTVCRHDDREAIDFGLLAGQPLRDIARRHGVGKDAVARHGQAHVSPALAVVRREREQRGAETLVDRVERLYERASAILDAAEAEGRPTVALGAVRELRGIVETLGKLTGELDEKPTTNVVNLIASPDWIAVRGALLDALRPFPDARAIVAGRLLELEAAS